MTIRYNPAKGWKSEHKKLAERIAKDKGIKVKSAMRYIQRVIAPVGKQRIAKPKYTGLKKSTQKLVKAEMYKFHRQSFKDQLEKHVDSPLTYKAILDYVYPQVEIDYAKPVKMVGKFGDSREGDWIDELTIFSNLVGVEDAADILGADEMDLMDLFTGDNTDRRIKKAIYTEFKNYKADNINIDKDVNESIKRGAVLKEILDTIKTEDHVDIMRQAIALGKINIEYINRDTLPMFGNLTQNQLDRILQSAWLDNFEGKVDLNMMYATYYADDKDVLARKGGYLDESVFWAWYRELFYSETGD